MKPNDFLKTLNTEDKLELVDPSDEISESYSDKSTNCLKSAKLLLDNQLYENSIGMSYYAMYNLLISLMFKSGIKSENHAGSILILKCNRYFQWGVTLMIYKKVAIRFFIRALRKP